MAVLTGTPVAGIHTYFGLAPAATPTGPVDDVSDFLDSVEPSSDTDELDATTFRRPGKVIIPGFTQRGISLSGKWSPEAETFFAPLEGLTGVKYEYGPSGNASGDPLISGTCSVLSYSGPQASVDGITTFTVELRLNEKTSGVVTPATGAVAGSPGTWTPPGATAPATLTALTGASPAITATPATAWTTGQHVVLGDASTAHWSGTAWVAGSATFAARA